MSRNLEQLRTVIEMACLTRDRTRAEHSALLAVARRADAEANLQTTTNSLLRGQDLVPCDFQTGPPESHVSCKCSPPPHSEAPPDLVRRPPGGWWRLAALVEETLG